MEFRELKTFQAVASLSSFSKAANVLNYAQSTVSSQIQSLENSLGVVLFTRSGNKITLTRAGIKLLKNSQRLINLEKEIMSNFKSPDETSWNLVMKIPHSVACYFLPQVIKQFQNKFPNICFDFDGCVGYNVYEVFNAGLIDIAFLISDNFSDDNLHVEDLSPVELAFVSDPHDDTFNGPIESINDFNGKTLLISKSDCSYRMIFEKMLMEAGVRLNKTIEVNCPEALRRMLLCGCKGVAFLPEVAVKDEISNGSLKRIKWKGTELNAKLYMIWNRDKLQTDAAKAFVNIVREYFFKKQA